MIFLLEKSFTVIHRPIFKTSMDKDSVGVVSSCDSRCLNYKNITTDYALLIKILLLPVNIY